MQSFHEKFMEEVSKAGVRDIPAAPRTLGERLVAWFTDTPLHAEEREYWLQKARRMQLRTILQEERIAQRMARKRADEARLSKYSAVGAWTVVLAVSHEDFRYSYSDRYEDTSVVITLEENPSGDRKLDIATVTNPDIEDAFGYDADLILADIKTQDVYTRAVLPWLDGRYTAEQMHAAAAACSYGAVTRDFVVYGLPLFGEMEKTHA